MKDDERGHRSEAEKLYSCAIDVALQTVSINSSVPREWENLVFNSRDQCLTLYTQVTLICVIKLHARYDE